MQHEITESGPLLDKQGSPAQAGYARKLLPVYDRNAIRASKLHIKEWDYYFISNGSVGLALTISDNGYLGMMSASLLDFTGGVQTTKSVMVPFTMGKLKLPASSLEGQSIFKNKKCEFSFEVQKDQSRVLHCRMDDFKDGKSLSADIRLRDVPEESMVIVVPFPKKKTAFYYNQKINCMRAEGTIDMGDTHYEFKASDSFGVLDWGRGVWTYDNTWYWSSASGLIDGKCFGFNLGYGFGDTSAATENMLFYEGRAHKLDQVRFAIPTNHQEQDDYMSAWTFSSSDGRFEARFEPLMDRADRISIGPLLSDQHQVFGKFNGKAVLDDGTEILMKDFFGFAEKVHNKW